MKNVAVSYGRRGTAKNAKKYYCRDVLGMMALIKKNKKNKKKAPKR